MSHKNRQPSVSSTYSTGSVGSSNWSHDSQETVFSAAGTFDPGPAIDVMEGFLPCEFVGYGECNMSFALNDLDNWIEHIIRVHLEQKLPRVALCWFCDHCIFDVRKGGSRRDNFRQRMLHIREHVRRESKSVYDMRPDHHMNDHLLQHRLITENAYNYVRRTSEVPLPDGMVPLSHSRRH